MDEARTAGPLESVLTALYEDRHRTYAPARVTPTCVATRAVEPGP